MIGNFVYFVSDGNRVKIGVTRDLVSRMVGLQCGNPNRLELIKLLKFDTYNDAQRVEKALHKKYDELRIKTHESEWFEYSVDFLHEESSSFYIKTKNRTREMSNSLYGEKEVFPMSDRPRCFFYPENNADLIDGKQKLLDTRRNPFRTMKYPTHGKQLLLPFSIAADRVFISKRKHEENMELKRYMKGKNEITGLEEFYIEEENEISSLENFF